MCSTLRSCAVFALALGLARPAGAQSGEDKRPDPPDPVISEYLDTAAVRSALASRPALTDERRGARIVTVAFDSLGRVANVRALLPQLMPAGDREALAALVKPHLRDIAARPRGWETHLLLGTGPEAGVEETAITRRNAELADRGQLTRRLEREAARLIETEPALPSQLTVRLRLEIDEDGLVAAQTILASSGRPAVDEAAVRVVRPSRFTPAIIEGVTVRTLVVLPIRFVFPD
jgi:TonB family protein